MTPDFPIYNLDDSVLGYIEQFSEHPRGYNPRTIHGPYLNHLLFIKPGVPVVRAGVTNDSSFSGAVSHIVGVGSNKKVYRIAARSIVAAVTAFKAFWNWSIGEHPCNPVRNVGFPRVVPTVESAVSVVGFSTNPRPAIIVTTFMNMAPESIFGCRFDTHVGIGSSYFTEVSSA